MGAAAHHGATPFNRLGEVLKAHASSYGDQGFPGCQLWAHLRKHLCRLIGFNAQHQHVGGLRHGLGAFHHTHAKLFKRAHA